MMPRNIKKFADILSSLPSIGPRQAIRLSFRLAGVGKSQIEEIISAASGLLTLELCPNCFFPYEKNNENNQVLCPICNDPLRNSHTIAIVEKETDLISLEKTKKFSGKYLVIGESKKPGILSDGQKIRLASLKNIAQKNGILEEIIIAINPNAYGDLVASFVAEEIRPYTGNISRLGRGLPTGGEIEFADEETLGHAIINRH